MALTGLSFLDRLLGDAEIASLLSTEADLAAMLAFEKALARAEAAVGMIGPGAATSIAAAIDRFTPNLARLTDAALRDGVVVPDLVRQIREAVGGEAAAAVHIGATSQDVIDTALALTLKPVFDTFEERLTALDAVFDDLIEQFGDAPLMARSRMQAAIEITVGDRVSNWRMSVLRVAEDLPRVRAAIEILTLAGAAGTAEKFGGSIDPVRAHMADALGLGVPDYVPHADRGRIADLANWLSRLTGTLGKIGQDAALMAQNGIGAIKISGAGGSSAMPHKQNPVRAELLVTLARYNATQLSAIHQALVHEQERSGSAWTLEWLVLAPMVETAGAALLHAQSMLSAVERIGDPR
ncbi:3-carboxy-cis,cis-muconate cycloisomerase [Rhizobium halophytocola]|uniref:3-carboxy-cis,cis-muconate cycloisomerase n=1 Tax=Rhizobium halophytocola TaxID=735519 RepID=A0ABS4E1A6_9HYPH|nr:3-carboxy-cis,cis-muconate cycloisomerase [Rhizobium halophytocola]MBP1851689.1 3-carboxy-cis,cis-muconate cycloisomerase [Rhizobium halophytocola]